jgi:hypothetical protein
MFTFHADPGHGWLQVPRKMLTELGIDSEISGYSYQSGDYAYLEEDMDFSTFARAYMKKHGKPPEFEEIYREVTVIRNYAPYSRKEN